MRLFRYDLPLLTSPLPLSVRSGLLLQTEQGWGEIAPLPGFSKETLEEALEDLEREQLPSVQFGFTSLQKPFPKSFPEISISALASTLEEASKAISAGSRTLKIKAKSPEETLRLLSCIEKPPSLQLRIDVNRKWSFPEAVFFFKNLDPSNLEYVEEPVNDPHTIAELPPLPIALDETLLQEDAEQFCSLPHVVALVLKPTLLGNRINRFLLMKKKLVFSSSFESPIGLMHIAHMQKHYAPQHAAGLDTARYFKELGSQWFTELVR